MSQPDRPPFALADWPDKPWCAVTRTDGGHRITYQEAGWADGITFSGLMCDDFPGEVAKRVKVKGEPARVDTKAYVVPDKEVT